MWRLANNKNVRFGELKRIVPGISSRVLTERLRKLESAGLVDRAYKPTIPPEVSYSLSKRGMELRVILNQLSALSIKWDLAETCGEDSVEKQQMPKQADTQASVTKTS